MPLRKRKNVRINPTESDHDDIAEIFNQYMPADGKRLLYIG